MSRLFVPPHVADELRAESQQFASVVDNACFQDRTCIEWTRELNRLDPLLDMIKAPDQQVLGTPLVPGAYHVRRANPGAPPSLIPVVDEHGVARPHPPGYLLEQLKGMDTWNVNAASMRKRIADEQEAAAQRDEQRRTEARQAQMVKDYKSVTNASVSMNRETAWGQNARGASQQRANKKQGT